MAQTNWGDSAYFLLKNAAIVLGTVTVGVVSANTVGSIEFEVSGEQGATETKSLGTIVTEGAESLWQWTKDTWRETGHKYLHMAASNIADLATGTWENVVVPVGEFAKNVAVGTSNVVGGWFDANYAGVAEDAEVKNNVAKFIDDAYEKDIPEFMAEDHGKAVIGGAGMVAAGVKGKELWQNKVPTRGEVVNGATKYSAQAVNGAAKGVSHASREAYRQAQLAMQSKSKS